MQHTLSSIEEKNLRREIEESEITEEALLKLLKITVFMIKKHWAHTYNYKDFVEFVSFDLGDAVLKKYMELAESHKNATYLSTTTVVQFVKVISEWMKEETLEELRNCEDFTLLLDESTDESNRSELCLQVRIVKGGEIQNHFLDLLQLKRGDARSIFDSIVEYCQKNEINLDHARFGGMDGCTVMSGEHNGLKALLGNITPHFIYIHCRNHRLALCFAHLIPEFKEFENFDGLLLNLYLLLKKSTVKQSIFDEVQKAYNLTSLKLIKAAVTRWLSHGQAGQRVLDRYEALIAALDEIFLRKHEPAVRGLRDDLIKPTTIATLCILTDVIMMTNTMQRFLQSSRLNFLDIPREKEKLIEKLNAKYNSPSALIDSYFGKLESFLDIAKQSAEGRYESRSNKAFDPTSFEDKVIKPFISKLVDEIEIAFNIPEHLKGFTALDPAQIPQTEEELASYGKSEIESISQFYGSPSLEKRPIINATSLITQYEGFKKFVFKKRLEWETERESELETAKIKLNGEEKKKATLSSIYSKRKIIKLDKNIKTYENRIEELEKTKKYTFEIMLKQWVESGFQSRHPELSRILNLAALIPPSTAEVERSFSLMKLICTKLRNRLTPENLGACMRICKFRKLNEEDFSSILKKWFEADGTKSGKRKIAHRLQNN